MEQVQSVAKIFKQKVIYFPAEPGSSSIRPIDCPDGCRLKQWDEVQLHQNGEGKWVILASSVCEKCDLRNECAVYTPENGSSCA